MLAVYDVKIVNILKKNTTLIKQLRMVNFNYFYIIVKNNSGKTFLKLK